MFVVALILSCHQGYCGLSEAAKDSEGKDEAGGEASRKLMMRKRRRKRRKRRRRRRKRRRTS